MSRISLTNLMILAARLALLVFATLAAELAPVNSPSSGSQIQPISGIIEIVARISSQKKNAQMYPGTAILDKTTSRMKKKSANTDNE